MKDCAYLLAFCLIGGSTPDDPSNIMGEKNAGREVNRLWVAGHRPAVWLTNGLIN